MKLCGTFFLFGLACVVPVGAGAATSHAHARHHRRHAHHVHRVSPAAVAPENAVAEVAAPELATAPVAESAAHKKRRLRGVVPPQIADAAVFNPPARIRHIPPPMKGTHALLLHQNEMADEEHVGRIEDDADLLRMRKAGLLVPIPVTAVLRVNAELPANRRYTRPWTAKFLSDISRAHYQRYHSFLQVNSAVRTAAFQRALLRVNANAAPAEGSLASPHLTGQTVDIAKKELSAQEIAWMRLYLGPLQRAGKIDVEEEFQQACFHVSVYRDYLPVSKTGVAGRAVGQAGHAPSRRQAPAPARRPASSAALLAARLR